MMKVSLILSRGFVLAWLVQAGCGSRGDASQQPKAPTIRTSLDARWVPLRTPRSVSFLELPATVLTAAGATAAMNPPYSGQVVKVHVRVGERVKRGQPVADIMMPAVVAAAAENAAAHTKLDAYVSRMVQLKTLKAEGLARTADIADVEMRLAEARADQIRAEAVLRSAGVDPREGARLATSGGAVPLRSPIDGVVTEISAALGETRDSAGAPFARIAGGAAARIEARAPQALPVGARFELVSAAGDPVTLRLVGEAPVVDPRDGTRAAWFEPEPARALAGGLTGRVRVILPDGAGLTIAPVSAVGKKGLISFVRARRGDDTTEVPVKIVQSSGADVLIESSLAAGVEIAERVAEPAR